MEKLENVQTIMSEFAKRTCIAQEGCQSVRYLWTDAYAVCNYLGLFNATHERKWLNNAVILANEVHHVLGKHRSDDPVREGWISGLSKEEGEVHPTVGGLRIGKKHDERKENDSYNERLEWDQDGQYFHYLTKWMHALSLLGKVTHDQKYHRWAVELAKTAFSKFSYTTFTHERRLYWKMSIDLSYSLVSSMGQHDALDGYITFLALQQNDSSKDELILQRQTDILEQMAMHSHIATDDPLGIGEVLSDAFILMQMICEGERDEKLIALLLKMLRECRRGIDKFIKGETLYHIAEYRLAFRELGLSIGLHSVAKMHRILQSHPECFLKNDPVSLALYDLEGYFPLCELIETFWMDPNSQNSRSWREHEDINSVMLATSLYPEGYLQT